MTPLHTYTETRGLRRSRLARPNLAPTPGTFRRPVVIHRRRLSGARWCCSFSRGLGDASLAVWFEFRVLAPTAEQRRNRAYQRLTDLRLDSAVSVPVVENGPMFDQDDNPFVNVMVGWGHPDGPDFAGRYQAAATVKAVAEELGLVSRTRLRGTCTPPMLVVTVFSPDCPPDVFGQP